VETADRITLLRFAESYPLSQAVPPGLLPLYVEAGMALGEALAARARKSFGARSAEEILKDEGVQLKMVDAPPAEGVRVLAEYQAEPPTVRVYPARIEHTRRQLREEGRNDLAERLGEIALTHELYHYLWHSSYEEQRPGDLVDLLGLSSKLHERIAPERLLRSPLTQEIASLSFVRTLLHLPELPLL